MMHDENFEDLKLIKYVRKLWHSAMRPAVTKLLKMHISSVKPNLL